MQLLVSLEQFYGNSQSTLPKVFRNCCWIWQFPQSYPSSHKGFEVHFCLHLPIPLSLFFFFSFSLSVSLSFPLLAKTVYDIKGDFNIKSMAMEYMSWWQICQHFEVEHKGNIETESFLYAKCALVLHNAFCFGCQVPDTGRINGITSVQGFRLLRGRSPASLKVILFQL